MIPDLYKTRLRNLRAELKKKKIQGLLVSRDIHIRFLTGFRGDDSWALITPSRVFILSDSRYAEEIQKDFPWTSLQMRSGKKSLFELIIQLAKKGGAKRLGFESQIVTYAFYEGLRQSSKGVTLIPASGIIERLRIIKTPGEIRALQKAAQITDQVLGKMVRRANSKMTELELKTFAEDQIKGLGGEGPSFELIIANGTKTARPHAVAGKNRLKSGTLLMIDMGSKVDGYHSDLTRTFFTGSISAKFRQIYRAVLEAQEAAISVVRPGIPVGKVDEAARSRLASEGLDKYFKHSTGHGVGLEIHEAPGVFHTNKELIRENMVFTVEPGVYIPGWGGIRIEDCVQVTKTGCKAITKYPKNKLKVTVGT